MDGSSMVLAFFSPSLQIFDLCFPSLRKSMHPSKADRILSRYRLIAPKPASTTAPSSTCASLESLASSGKYFCRRSRKRRPAPIGPVPSRYKAAKASSTVPVVSGSSVAAAGPSLGPLATDVGVPTHNVPSYGGGCSNIIYGTGFAADPAVGTGDASWADYCAGICGQNLAHNEELFEGVGILARNDGFVEREAASQGLAEKEPSIMEKGCFPGPGFTEMIRGITRLPTAADVHSLLQGSCTTVGGSAVTMRSSPTDSSVKDMRRTLCLRPQHVAEPLASQLWRNAMPTAGYEADIPTPVDFEQSRNLWASFTRSNEAISDANETGIVTLPLLPGGPSRLDSAASDFLLTACSSAAKAKLCGQSTTQSTPVDVTSTAFKNQKGVLDGSLVDHAYLEQVYGASTEPVLLLDESNNVVWSNRSYERASKCASEHISRDGLSSEPYIDPLGHPTPLGTFFIRTRISKVTLWGFLKKLVVRDPGLLGLEEGRSSCSSAGAQVQAPSILDSAHDLSLCTWEDNVASTSQGTLAAHTHAIIPPKVSLITLECITDLHLHCSPLMESLESVEARLSNGNPVFITDCVCRVRWMNTSLMRMLGHFEDARPGLMPALLNVYSMEKLPQTVAAFSGRVNVEWVQAGRRRSMTIPCDVCLLIPSSATPGMWVWRLDASAGLGLACGFSC